MSKDKQDNPIDRCVCTHFRRDHTIKCDFPHVYGMGECDCREFRKEQLSDDASRASAR